MNKTDKINNELKQENIELKNSLRNIVYPDGPALYLITKILHHKKYYKLGFTKNLNKRLKVYNTGSPNKIYYNYFIMVKNKHIDSCMKNIMKNQEFIKNKEFIWLIFYKKLTKDFLNKFICETNKFINEFYLARLSRILEFIKSCDLNLDKICCGYCLKCYRFNKIKMHKCKYIIY